MKAARDLEILTVANGFIVRPSINHSSGHYGIFDDNETFVFSNAQELAKFIENEYQDRTYKISLKQRPREGSGVSKD